MARIAACSASTHSLILTAPRNALLFGLGPLEALAYARAAVR
jgi:hypothetical protein